jgi:hypothetical protein
MAFSYPPAAWREAGGPMETAGIRPVPFGHRYRTAALSRTAFELRDRHAPHACPDNHPIFPSNTPALPVRLSQYLNPIAYRLFVLLRRRRGIDALVVDFARQLTALPAVLMALFTDAAGIYRAGIQADIARPVDLPLHGIASRAYLFVILTVAADAAAARPVRHSLTSQN